MIDEKTNRLIYDLFFNPALQNGPEFTEEQWKALCGEIPMTQELYNTCLSVCAKSRDVEYFCIIQDGYPEYKEGYDVYLEEITGRKMPTPVEAEASYQRLREKVKERFGVDLLPNKDDIPNE